MSPYDDDVYAWTQTQAAALRAKDWAALDLEHLAEEIERLGRRDRRAIRSQLARLLQHFLTWAYQPQGHGASWRGSMEQARHEIAALLAESPSLRDDPAQRLSDAYRYARRQAAHETGLPLATLPETCPWMLAQLQDEDFWPEEGQ